LESPEGYASGALLETKEKAIEVIEGCRREYGAALDSSSCTFGS
jgi:hypothetical protein